MKKCYNSKLPALFAVILLWMASCPVIKAEEDYTGMEIPGYFYLFVSPQSDPMYLVLNKYIEKDYPHDKLIIPESYNLDFFSKVGPREAVFQRIGSRAFSDMERDELNRKWLDTIVLPRSIKVIEDYAFKDAPICHIILNEGLKSIGKEAFTGSWIRSIKIPESVRWMDYGAFHFCQNLTEVDLPASLESLGGGTFNNCISLRKIICRATTPPEADEYDFDEGSDKYYSSDEIEPPFYPDECELWVPKASIELYKNARGWRVLNNIQAIEDMPAEVKEVSQEAESLDFSIENHVLTISCREGDHLSIYDMNGIRLENKKFTAPSQLTHRGTGVRIVTLNGKSVKVVL